MDNPILIPGWPRSWPCQKWTFQSLALLLQNKQLSCRVWKKSRGQIFETDCKHLDITLHHFCEWLEGKATLDNPLYLYSRNEYNCYIDYKYMKDMFESVPEVLHDVKWQDFGLAGLDGFDSTIWIGSEGSNTPCHQDSYGFNLVTQIQGRKLWILFPPCDTPYLYPTRIPYEESSVFSQVDVKNPNVHERPDFQSSHPMMVILNPGQTLYVPNQWWHYVESLQPSISINVWVPMEHDKHQRVSEAVTRCLASCLISNLAQDSSLQSQLLNPTENLHPSRVNFTFLKTVLEQLDPAHDLETNKDGMSEERDMGSGGSDETSQRHEHTLNTPSSHCNRYNQFQRWIKQLQTVNTETSIIHSSTKILSSEMTKSLPKLMDVCSKQAVNKRPSSDVSSKAKKKRHKKSGTQLSYQQSGSELCSNENDACGSGSDFSISKHFEITSALEKSIEWKETQVLFPHAVMEVERESSRQSCQNKLQVENILYYPNSSVSQNSETHESCSDQKPKIFTLSSLPFQEYQSILKGIFLFQDSEGHHIDSEQSFTGADTDTHQAAGNSTSVSLPSHTAVPKPSEKCNDERPQVSKMSSQESCGSQGYMNKNEKESFLADSELVTRFISSVLHPSVIERISFLIKEDYSKP